MSTPRPYVVRFHRFRPAATVAAGVAAFVVSSVWLVHAARGARLGDGPPALALLIIAMAMIGAGAARLVRGHRKEWIALTIDTDGIYLADCAHSGAQSDGREARRLSWDEVSAVILFSRRTEFVRGTVKCIGVRLNPSVAGSPEDHLTRLKQVLSQPGLELRLWKELRELDRALPEPLLKTAVSVHAEARGWRYRRSSVVEAMQRYAPGVPVITSPADDYYHLVGWRADQEKLREILEDAELGRWGA